MTSKRHTSIYLGPHLAKVLDRGAPAGKSVSSRIDTMAERYLAMVDSLLPVSWTESQLRLATHAAQALVGADAVKIRLLGDLVAEMAETGADKAFGVDAKSFAYQVRNLSRAQLIAIVDRAEVLAQ